MKKISFILMTIFCLNISSANAGFYESGYFEPTLGCALGAGVGYTSSDTNQGLNAALFCAGGLVLGVIANSYYRKKVDLVHERELSEKETKIIRKRVELANRANIGDTSIFYGLQGEQLEEAKEVGGQIISPTKRILLEAP